MTTVTLKGNQVTLKGIFLSVGQKAPDFLLVGSDLHNKTLKDFSQKKLLVIVPSLDTEVCSLSSKKFSDHIKDKSDVALVVISADLPFAQKRFCGTKEVSNATTLSMMRDKSFAENYGVLIQEGPLAGLCARAVLLLDQDNKVLYAELVPEITNEPAYDKVLALL